MNMKDCKKCVHGHFCWGFGMWFDPGWTSQDFMFSKSYMRTACMGKDYALYEEKEEETKDDTVRHNCPINFGSIFPFNFFSSGSRRHTQTKEQVHRPGVESSTR